MPAFTAATLLFDIMRDPDTRGIIAADIPELANNPLLHTLHRYPLKLIPGTEESLFGDEARQTELLARITAIEPEQSREVQSRHPGREGRAVDQGRQALKARREPREAAG